MGTRNSVDVVCVSNSGRYTKSMVELSLMALRLRLVLKWRTGLPVLSVSGTEILAEAGRRGAWERPAGLSDVITEEKGEEPVMERFRVNVFEVEVRALRARTETRAVDMIVLVRFDVMRWKCGEMISWKCGS
jgi:hypothetical protein